MQTEHKTGIKDNQIMIFQSSIDNILYSCWNNFENKLRFLYSSLTKSLKIYNF